jgi:erythromycin esterase-like protein
MIPLSRFGGYHGRIRPGRLMVWAHHPEVADHEHTDIWYDGRELTRREAEPVIGVSVASSLTARINPLQRL